MVLHLLSMWRQRIWMLKGVHGMGTALQRDTKAAMRLSHEHGIHNAFCMICCDLSNYAFRFLFSASSTRSITQSFVSRIRHVSPLRCMQQPIWAYYRLCYVMLRHHPLESVQRGVITLTRRA